MAIPEVQDTSGRLTDCIYFGDPLSANVGSGFVPNARTITTVLPLTGGGDLSANRTLNINEFAGSVPGTVPTSLGGVVTFLRADGSWATPPTFGAAAAGYAPASGGGAVNFLRADGTWAAPAGTGISGLTTDYLTVATAATAIGNARAFQTATGFEFDLAQDGFARWVGLRADFTIATGTIVRPIVPSLPSGTYTYGLTLRGGGDNLNDAYLTIEGNTATFQGRVCFPPQTVTVVNGPNILVGPAAPYLLSAWYRAIGPTSAFSIDGIGGGSDGSLLTVFNTTTQAMTIKNESLAAAYLDRVMTLTAADVVLPAGMSSATFMYSGAEMRWILIQTNPPGQYPRTLGYVPYQNSGGNLADSTLFHDSANNRYGFGTATPTATVDIQGTVSVRRFGRVLSNGLNSNIPVPTTSFMRVSGPTGAFSIGGITTVASEDGKRLTIYNSTAQAMTIVNEDLSSTAAYRITTTTGANIVFPARESVVHLIYNNFTSRWLVDEANPVTAGGATTQVQSNLSGSLYGDTGLTVTGTGATKVLTLGTDVEFSRKTTRHFQLGASAASTNAYVVTGQSTRGGTDSNLPGGHLSIGGGAGTGTAGGGDTIIQTANPGVLGNTQNVLVDRLVHAAKPVALTDATPTNVLTVGIPTETGSGGTLYYTIYATDGVDMQIRRGRLPWGAVNKASTITVALGTPEEVDCTPVGTLTVTITALDNADDTFSFQFDTASSLTETVLQTWVALQHDGYGTVVTI